MAETWDVPSKVADILLEIAGIVPKVGKIAGTAAGISHGIAVSSIVFDKIIENIFIYFYFTINILILCVKIAEKRFFLKRMVGAEEDFNPGAGSKTPVFTRVSLPLRL